MSYHAGAVAALDRLGFDLRGAEVIVGTSAGAVVAAYLAAGWTPMEVRAYASGRNPDALLGFQRERADLRDLFGPLYETGLQRAARSIGGAFVALSARGLLRHLTHGRRPAALLRRAFPAGLYRSDATRRHLERDLPAAWPHPGLLITAVDVYTAERVAFGAPGAPPATLPEAVLSSTAIPGVFPPVRIGSRYFVDGGIHSATSVDLAVAAGCDHVLVIAPLGYRRDPGEDDRDPTTWAPRLARSPFHRSLRREVSEARSRGIEVLTVMPTLQELRRHGTNAMRRTDGAAICEEAARSTRALVLRHHGDPVVAAFTGRNAEEERVS